MLSYANSFQVQWCARELILRTHLLAIGLQNIGLTKVSQLNVILEIPGPKHKHSLKRHADLL